jgi:hypothetical protein
MAKLVFSPTDASHDQQDKIELFLYLNSHYLVPAIVIFGCVNNIFVLVVLSLSQYRKHVSCLYLRCLAVFDTMSLVAVGLLSSENAMPTLAETLGDVFCAVLGFSINLTPEMSSWIIVGITFTRFVAVVYPLQAAAWSTFRAAKIFLLCLFVTFLLAAIPDLLYNRVPRGDKMALNFGCVMLMDKHALDTYHTIHMVVGVVIPVIFLLILNAPIAFKLITRNKDNINTSSTTTGRAGNPKTKEEKMVIMMAMVVTVAFFFLVVPYVFHFIIWYFVSSIYELDRDRIQQRTLSYIIVNDLFAVNCSVNFLLYFITCQRFRADFKSVLLCRCWRNVSSKMSTKS